MLRIITGIVIGYLMAAVFIASSGIIIALVPIRDSIAFEYDALRAPIAVFVMFFSASFGLFFSWIGLIRFHIITNALEGFDEYQTDFKERWGDVD